MLRSKFGGQTFHQADQRSLAGSVIGVERLASLAGGRADHNDMSRGFRSGGGLHGADRIFDQGEDRIEVDRHSFSPLLVAHGIDSHIFGAPNSMIGHQDIEAAELGHTGPHELTGSRGSIETESYGTTVFFPQLASERFGLARGFLVVEENLRPGLDKHANRGGADAPRASRDQ